MANVLIVDDDVDLADASRMLLESVGHRIRIGHSGREGLATLAAAPLPDCVLLDVEMPVLDGPGMAHQMFLNEGGEEQIPILLISGRGDLSEIAARMGTPYFLEKASRNYCKVLLKMLAQALCERRAPAPA